MAGQKEHNAQAGEVEKGQVCVATLICSALKRACSFSWLLSLSLRVGRQWVLGLDELGAQDQFCHFLGVSSSAIFLSLSNIHSLIKGREIIRLILSTL